MQFSRKILTLSILLAGFVLWAAMSWPKVNLVEDLETDAHPMDEMGVGDIYKKLGKIPMHEVKTDVKGVSAEKGKEIVFKGITTDPDGKRIKKQSKFYTCIACHNTVKEFDNMADISPESRLDYAIKNKIPYLQGSSFYGIVNRTNFYNDEYQKKYGGVPGIEESKTDIRAAIQVCATTCSQGRELEEWELESVLAYFWTIQLRVGDLKLSNDQKDKIKSALETRKNTDRAIDYIRDAFVPIRPAHFSDPIEYKVVGDENLKDAKRLADGKGIYELSCLHCHGKERFSFFNLDNSRATFKHLNKALRKQSYHSVYKISRYGTGPKKGRKAYMPQYTLEKMSDEQLESLRIYIQAVAEGKYKN
jgi:mono/diheme cytochrome c family protein